MTSLEWVEAHSEPLTTVEAVREYLEGLAQCLDEEVEDCTGKARWRARGEAFGLRMALAAMRDLT